MCIVGGGGSSYVGAPPLPERSCKREANYIDIYIYIHMYMYIHGYAFGGILDVPWVVGLVLGGRPSSRKGHLKREASSRDRVILCVSDATAVANKTVGFINRGTRSVVSWMCLGGKATLPF